MSLLGPTRWCDVLTLASSFGHEIGQLTARCRLVDSWSDRYVLGGRQPEVGEVVDHVVGEHLQHEDHVLYKLNLVRIHFLTDTP